MKSFSTLMNVVHLGTQFTKWDLTYLLIALFLLNQCKIFFLGNLDDSLHCITAGAFAYIRVDFDPLVRFSNFPRLLLSSSKCVSFCFASRVLWLISLLLMLPVVLSEITCDSNIGVLSGSLKVSLVRFTRKRLTICPAWAWRIDKQTFGGVKDTSRYMIIITLCIFSLSNSFHSVTCACAAGIVWENRF